jgi:hypothetical protein
MSDADDTPATRKRPRLQFGLRTFFVVMTLFCVLGWIGWCVTWIQQRHLVATELYLPEMASEADVDNDPFASARKGLAPWQLRLFGEQGYSEIYLTRYEPNHNFGPSQVFSTDEDRDRISRLFPEAEVVFWNELKQPAQRP